jgi:dTMP kinase
MRRELWSAVGWSLSRVPGPRADVLRAGLAERDRLAGLRACEGVDGEWPRRFRERLFPLAPKRVLRSLAGVDAQYAWSLRARALAATGEALESMTGLDGEHAWALRDEGVGLWPAMAVLSLGPLARRGRGLALIARALALAPANVVVLRNAHAALAALPVAASPPSAHSGLRAIAMDVGKRL